VLVSQHLPRIEMYKRQEKGWYFSDVTGLDQTVNLESIQCRLTLSEIFHKVDFSQTQT
jgi:hypothetical protein